MGPVLKAVLYGAVGLLLALTLSVASFAIAGRRLGVPAPAVTLLDRPKVRDAAPSDASGPHSGRPTGAQHPSPTDDIRPSSAPSSPSPDDHGVEPNDDHGGTGSGDDDHDDD